MASGLPVTPGSGANVAADTIGSATPPSANDRVQYVKLDLGGNGASSPMAGQNGGVPVDAAGTKVAAATIPTGGVGLLGWLSAIWYQLTQTLTTSLATATSGGCATYHNAALGTAPNVVVKSAPGQLYALRLINTSTTQAAFVKLYDAAAAGTIGAVTVKETVCVPAANAAALPSVVLWQQVNGVAFATGVAFCVTGALADSDATPVVNGTLCLDAEYK